MAGAAAVALAGVVFLTRPQAAHGSIHPDPRPGVTAEKILPDAFIPHNPGATEAYALTKEGMNAAQARDLDSFLEIEAELQDRAGRTSDYARGVRAFPAKQRAEFEGR